MSVYKRGNVYSLAMPTQLPNGRGRLVMSTGMSSKASAEAFERKIKRLHEVAQVGLSLDHDLMQFVSGLKKQQWNKLIKHGLLKPESAALCLPLDRHLADFLESQREWVPEHARSVKHDLCEAIEFIGAHRLTDFTPERVDAYLASLMPRLSACTRNKRLKYLKQFLTWCVNHERLAKHRLNLIPVADVAMDQRRAKRPFTQEEFEALLATVPEYRKQVYLYAMLTGFRRSEISKLRWYDINWVDATVRLPLRMVKTRKEDVLPLHEHLLAMLQSMFSEQGQPSPGDRVFPVVPACKTWKRDLERANLQFVDEDDLHLYFHSLRVTFTTMLLRNGNTASQTKRATRHRDTAVLENHYNKLQVDDTRKMISELPSFRQTESSVECDNAPLPFVAQDVARIDPQAASDDAEVHLKQTVGRIASELLEDMWMVYNAESDAERMHVAPYVIDDFRKSFEVIKLRAHSSVG